MFYVKWQYLLMITRNIFLIPAVKKGLGRIASTHYKEIRNDKNPITPKIL